MPVFDLAAFTKYVIRIAFVIALVLYMAGLANTIGDMILSLWSMVSSSVDAFSSAVSSGGGTALSCTYYMMSELGISESIASFSIAAISLLVLWATTLVHMILLRYTLQLKGLFLEGTK